MFYLPCDNSSICFEEVVWQPTNLDLASHSPWKHLSQVLQLMLNLVMAMLMVKDLIQFVEQNYNFCQINSVKRENKSYNLSMSKPALGTWHF